MDWAGTTTFAFDARRSLIGKTDPGSLVQAYSYDPVMNRSKLVDPDAGIFTSSFDQLDRISALTNPSNETFTLSYDPNSRNTTMLAGNSSSRAIQYDPVSQLTTIIQYKGANPVVTIVDAYNGAGWKSSHNVNGTVTTYLNDAKGRLVGQQGAGLTATFVYDAIDNTSVKWHQGQAPMTMAYDLASRIVTMLLGSATTTYQFDKNGNMTLEVPIPPNGWTTYGFDYENRLTGVTPEFELGGAITAYSYAGDSGLRRTREESGPPIHTIVWDGSDYLGEY